MKWIKLLKDYNYLLNVLNKLYFYIFIIVNYFLDFFRSKRLIRQSFYFVLYITFLKGFIILVFINYICLVFGFIN